MPQTPPFASKLSASSTFVACVSALVVIGCGEADESNMMASAAGSASANTAAGAGSGTSNTATGGASSTSSTAGSSGAAGSGSVATPGAVNGSTDPGQANTGSASSDSAGASTAGSGSGAGAAATTGGGAGNSGSDVPAADVGGMDPAETDVSGDDTTDTDVGEVEVGSDDGASTDTPSAGEVACTFEIQGEPSGAIATVGIVNWSTDLQGMTAARIEFGLEGADSTLVAPVESPSATNRTLLLGMKGDQRYVYRVVAEAGTEVCTSEEHTIDTGPVDNNVTVLNMDVANPAAVAPGFMVLSDGIGNIGAGGFGGGTPGGGGGGGLVYIVDQDGDPVWWSDAPPSTSRARMDWEGANMWMLSLNVGNNGGGAMRRVSMDGMDVESNVAGLDDAHHDFTVAPGGIVTAMLWSGGGMDPPSDLVERSPDGSINVITTIGSNIYNSNTYHSNSIIYHPYDDSYTISDRNPNLYVKVSRTGQLVWQLGGNNPVGASFSGVEGWSVNHGHHITPEGTFLLFNNNGAGGGGGGGFGGGASAVLEFQIDETNMTATKVWEYAGGESSPTLGDVQRLPNGNTLITYSNSGTIVEVDPESNVVQTITGSGSFGYTNHRPSLYGPPPK